MSDQAYGDPRPVGFDFDPLHFDTVLISNSFKSASNFARSCSTAWKCVTSIKPSSGDQWAVLVDDEAYPDHWRSPPDDGTYRDIEEDYEDYWDDVVDKGPRPSCTYILTDDSYP